MYCAGRRRSFGESPVGGTTKKRSTPFRRIMSSVYQFSRYGGLGHVIDYFEARQLDALLRQVVDLPAEVVGRIFTFGGMAGFAKGGLGPWTFHGTRPPV